MSITLQMVLKEGKRAENVFFSVIRRLKGTRLEQVRKAYEGSLTLIAENFNEVGSVTAFHQVCDEGARAIQKPFILKMQKKLAGVNHTAWSADVERVARQRTRIHKKERRRAESQSCGGRRIA